jgi:prolyl-tRNA editing enzyme YbaK/EbsC (Cys-tRNA(Pro) deacylase)
MIPERVARILADHGLEALEFTAGSTPTVLRAAEMIGVVPGQIAKSLLLKGKDEQFRLFVLAGDSKLSSGTVKRLTGSKHRMSTARECSVADLLDEEGAAQA